MFNRNRNIALLFVGALILLVAGSTLGFPARGQPVGLVCVASASMTSCPSAAPAFTGLAGGTLTVSINVQNSDSFFAYDVIVNTNPVVLQPASVSFAGALLPPPPCPPSVVCSPPATITGGSVSVAIVSSTPTTPPSTGRLFSITYNIVSGSSAPIAASALLVGIVNGSPTPVPENLQTATFNALMFKTTFSNVNVTAIGSFQLTSTGVSGTAMVKATNNTSGLILFSKNFTIPIITFRNNQARFLLHIPLAPYPLSVDVTVPSAGTVSTGVSRDLDINGDGIVDIVDFAFVALRYSCFSTQSCYSPLADFNADGVVNIIDLGLIGLYYTAPAFR